MLQRTVVPSSSESSSPRSLAFLLPLLDLANEGITIPLNIRTTHPTAQHLIPAGLSLQQQCCENLKSWGHCMGIRAAATSGK
jgi:hypothetical protein